MLSIVRVDTLDNQTLDIELSNGSLILFNLTRLLETDRTFAGLLDQPLLPRPATDGRGIYWEGGPRIELADVFRLLNDGAVLPPDGPAEREVDDTGD